MQERTQTTYSETPTLGLVQVVWHGVGIQNGESGGVKGVLGDGNHDADLVALNNHLERELNTGGSTLCQKDLGGIGGVPIALRDELCNVLTDVGNTLGVGVGTNRANVLEQQLGTGNGIAREESQGSFGILVLEELWVFDEGGDLTGG